MPGSESLSRAQSPVQIQKHLLDEEAYNQLPSQIVEDVGDTTQYQDSYTKLADKVKQILTMEKYLLNTIHSLKHEIIRNIGGEDLLEMSNSKEHSASDFHPAERFLAHESNIYQNSPDIQHSKKLKKWYNNLRSSSVPEQEHNIVASETADNQRSSPVYDTVKSSWLTAPNYYETSLDSNAANNDYKLFEANDNSHFTVIPRNPYYLRTAAGKLADFRLRVAELGLAGPVPRNLYMAKVNKRRTNMIGDDPRQMIPYPRLG